MGTLLPTSEEVPEIDYQEGTSSSEQLDAGALFVLKSRGSWLHCGYHLTTSIVAPSLLSLPYALSLMGWFPGVLCLILAALVTFYSYNLLSLVLEHHAQLGRRQLRFRVMAEDILGPAWGRYFVGPIQFGVCYGSVISCILLGGQSLKSIYLLSTPEGSIQLYGFVSIFGILMLVLAQIPSFHSLRHISLVSLVLALAYSACTTAGSVHIGKSKNAPPKDYSIDGIMQNRVFGAFNAISIIATTYGNGIIPEIQATVAPPVEGKMFKGLLVCYAVITMTFFSVSISGYWAFGNQTKGALNTKVVQSYASHVSVNSADSVHPGSWLHCGYHLTTSIVSPSLLSLPYALSLMGWFPGVLCLILAALVTFYSYNLLSLVLEHHAQLGRRQLRFRVMAEDILGPAWGRYFVGPIQFGVCYGSVIACILLGGQSLKFIYLLSTPEGSIQLYGFVSIFGILMLVLAQIPSFHSLRHISLVSLVLALAYSACTTAGSVHIGKSKNAPPKDYSIDGIMQNRVFGAFNAISIIATTYGNGIIPEIQATVAPPVEGKMFKGLLVCYAVITMTFFSVAISGYWAFGNQTKGVILMNFVVDEKPLLPTWVLLMTNVFTLLQVAAVSVVYLQPTNDVFEGKFSDAKSDQFSIRNVVPRLVFRSLSVIIATAVAAMFPFFGDINAVIGAFGFIPLDFILPVIFYNVTFKPSKKGLMFWGNTAIAIICSAKQRGLPLSP
uniref:Amino acid transporter transmembrane domain-containing protein n=1 Tax=Salix viminalis TaxID=40686 RepID=A0A6N2M5I5_SALVM